MVRLGQGPVVNRGLSRPLFGGAATEFTPPRVAHAGPVVNRGLSRPLFGGAAPNSPHRALLTRGPATTTCERDQRLGGFKKAVRK
jgi:hypothetical protein